MSSPQEIPPEIKATAATFAASTPTPAPTLSALPSDAGGQTSVGTIQETAANLGNKGLPNTLQRARDSVYESPKEQTQEKGFWTRVGDHIGNAFQNIKQQSNPLSMLVVGIGEIIGGVGCILMFAAAKASEIENPYLKIGAASIPFFLGGLACIVANLFCLIGSTLGEGVKLDPVKIFKEELTSLERTFEPLPPPRNVKQEQEDVLRIINAELPLAEIKGELSLDNIIDKCSHSSLTHHLNKDEVTKYVQNLVSEGRITTGGDHIVGVVYQLPQPVEKIYSGSPSESITDYGAMPIPDSRKDEVAKQTSTESPQQPVVIPQQFEIEELSDKEADEIIESDSIGSEIETDSDEEIDILDVVERTIAGLSVGGKHGRISRERILKVLVSDKENAEFYRDNIDFALEKLVKDGRIRHHGAFYQIL